MWVVRYNKVKYVKNYPQRGQRYKSNSGPLALINTILNCHLEGVKFNHLTKAKSIQFNDFTVYHNHSIHMK